MTSLAARVLMLAVGSVIGLLAACSGETNDDLIAQPPAPTIEAAGPTPTVEAAPPSNSEPTAAPAPTATAAKPTPTGPQTVQLWFPIRGANGTGPTAPRPVDRSVVFEADSTVAERLSTIVDLWITGPSVDEDAAGSLGFDYRFNHCQQPFAVEATDTAAVVTLCVRDRSANGLLGEALHKTLTEAALVAELALLSADGDRCVVFVEGADGAEDDPLACLPEEFRPTDAFRCPFTRVARTAIVTGVDEWANTRLGSSLDAPLAERLGAGAEVTVYPSTLSHDREGLGWLTIELRGMGRCGRVAAQLVSDRFGDFGDALPGISYQLPASGSWTFAERDSIFDEAAWRLDDAFFTQVSLQVFEGRRIDQRLAAELDRFEPHGYDPPADWYEEVDVTGADRAVRPVFTVSESGDVGTNTVWIEIGNFTVEARTDVYIEDIDIAPRDEMEAFLRSVRVDAGTFIDALTVPDGGRTTLFDNTYATIPEPQADASACGAWYEYYVLDEFGQLRYAGRLQSSSPSELADRRVTWPIGCKGGSPPRVAIGRIDDLGTIITESIDDPDS